MKKDISGQNKKWITFKKSFPYILFALPSLIYFILFNYAPMFGLVIAFKDYKLSKGIFDSKWVGLKNFEYFFKSNDIVRVLGNTILYQLLSLLVVGLFFGILFALLLYEVRSKHLNKLYQTTMLIPHFLSWVIIASLGLLFLNPKTGYVNSLLQYLGLEKVAWYSNSGVWPVLLVIFMIWKDAGMASLYLYASLLSIDTQLFEAASLDGANKWQQIWHVSLPHMKPMIAITIITRLGGILSADMGLFYQVPMDSGPLYPTTDVLATYLYRGLQSGSYSITAAVGLFQAVVGLVLVLLSNGLIRKISPENAMF